MNGKRSRGPDHSRAGDGSKVRRRVGLLLGPLLLVAVLLAPRPEILDPAAQAAAAVVLLMAVWWITEAVPIAATALLPLVLFPLLDVAAIGEVSAAYANPVVFLFLGGFLIAVAMEGTGLHRRLALRILALVGTTPRRVLLGFMLSSALLSMWISNTAAAMMMITIAMAVMASVEGRPLTADRPLAPTPFGRALMLTIAYSCSLGGVMTIIGSPPNAILVGVLSSSYGIEVSFLAWMAVGVPVGAVMLGFVWLLVTRPGAASPSMPAAALGAAVDDQIARLPPISAEERGVLWVFSGVALTWIAHPFVPLPLVRGLDDAMIAIAGALALFLWPAAGRPGSAVLGGEALLRVPWDIIILFGGGFALAHGVAASGLTGYIAERFAALDSLPPALIVALVALTVVFLTEVTSNTATASLLVPVAGAFAAAVAMRPADLMLVTALAASFAFMLPVATPPNAIAYGSRLLTIPFMARKGFALNLAAVAVLVSLSGLLRLVPEWFR